MCTVLLTPGVNRIAVDKYNIYIKDAEQYWQLTAFLNHTLFYRGADKSLARPVRKQANVSVRMA